MEDIRILNRKQPATHAWNLKHAEYVVNRMYGKPGEKSRIDGDRVPTFKDKNFLKPPRLSKADVEITKDIERRKAARIGEAKP